MTTWKQSETNERLLKIRNRGEEARNEKQKDGRIMKLFNLEKSILLNTISAMLIGFMLSAKAYLEQHIAPAFWPPHQGLPGGAQRTGA